MLASPASARRDGCIVTELILPLHVNWGIVISKKFSIFRIFQVYGKNQKKMLIPEILKHISYIKKDGKNELRLGDLSVKRDFIYIDDAVKIIGDSILDKENMKNQIKNIADLNEIHEEATIEGTIQDISVFTTRTRLRITTFKIADTSGVLSAKWFGPQYVERRFQNEERVFLTGKYEIKKNVMHLQTIMVWKLLGEHVATRLKKRKLDPNMT